MVPSTCSPALYRIYAIHDLTAASRMSAITMPAHLRICYTVAAQHVISLKPGWIRSSRHDACQHIYMSGAGEQGISLAQWLGRPPRWQLCKSASEQGSPCLQLPVLSGVWEPSCMQDSASLWSGPCALTGRLQQRKIRCCLMAHSAISVHNHSYQNACVGRFRPCPMFVVWQISSNEPEL